MVFTKTKELLSLLREYRQWVQDCEYKANEKTPEVMDGIRTLEKAESFIADLDAAVTKEADNISMRWAAAEERDNFEDLPIKRLHF